MNHLLDLLTPASGSPLVIIFLVAVSWLDTRYHLREIRRNIRVRQIMDDREAAHMEERLRALEGRR